MDLAKAIIGTDVLAPGIDLHFEDGLIRLAGQRMVLIHTESFGTLRQDLIQSLGLDRARALLTRMGFNSGKADARMMRRLLPDASAAELLKLGRAAHALLGVGKVIDINAEIGAKGDFDGEFIWDPSFEAEAHLAANGVSNRPVCWHSTGYASGYVSTVLGKFTLFRERECRGRGDACCRVVGKSVDRWEDAEDDLRYFKPEIVADQLIELQEQVASLRGTLASDNEGFANMVGASKSFLRICDFVRRVAATPATVLLLGETGVGKERFARSVHDLSGRRDHPFVAVNCGAIPESLIESELFGVEKGAFTGATKSRPGRFERAHNGTLFLDEVAEMTPSAQVRLLRVLQDGELERVGGTHTIRCNVRIVAATNKDLAQQAKDGYFRTDLYFRLNSFQLEIPPLRERKEDIPRLADHFLRRFAARDGRRNVRMSAQAHDALMAYDWPGNIRELENTIERGVILAGEDGTIEPSSLFGRLAGAAEAQAPQVKSPAVAAAPAAGAAAGSARDIARSMLDAHMPLESIEGALFSAALERTGGNQTRAAELLGLTRRQVEHWVKKGDPPKQWR